MFKNGEIVEFEAKHKDASNGKIIKDVKYIGKILKSERNNLAEKEFVYKILVIDTIPKTSDIGKDVFAYERRLQKKVGSY